MSPILATAGWSWTGALCGLLVSTGLLVTWHRLPLRRRLTLADRVEPYLRDATPPSALLGRTDARRVSARWPWLDDVVRRWADRIERVLGGADSVRRRQLRCGRPADVDAFRAEQVVWGAVAGGVGLVVALVVVLQTDASPIGMALLVLVATGCGVVAKDQALTREVARREALMLVEFPTIAELLALAIGAGEGASGALERVCRLSSGELSHELRLCLADARAGLSLPAALHLLADRTGLPSLARFVEGIVVAVERGTPLADVMRAQAQDVREESRRAVMEEGGRKEIAMMIPVVFLILPVTVVFAVFPGLALLQITV